MSNNKLHLAGKVIDHKTGQRIPGLKVEARNKNGLTKAHVLASATTGKDGDFEMLLDPDHLPKHVLEKSPSDLGLEIRKRLEPVRNIDIGAIRKQADGKYAVDITVDNPEEEDADTAGTPPTDNEAARDGSNRVSGRVTNDAVLGLSGMAVVAVDKNLGEDSDVHLGKSTSNAKGDYVIHYQHGSWKKGKTQPDIQVQVTDEKDKVLATSAVRYNAGPEEHGLDVTVPSGELPDAPAEYHQLVTTLDAHLDGTGKNKLNQALAELTENDSQQDITYLANKTGWDARLVAMSSLASQFSEQSKVDPELYYALFRAGVPANKEALAQVSPETAKRIWKQAIDENILPEKLTGKLQENLESFEDYSAGVMLDAPAQVGISSIQSLVAPTLPDTKDQQRFARLYHAHRDDLSIFWDKIGTEFPNKVERLQLDGKLGALTINNAALVKRLHAKLKTLSSPLDLVRQGLYKEDAWTGPLLADLPVPDEIPGATGKQQQANYAALMASSLRLSYPTAVIAEMVQADSIPLHAEQSVKTGVTQFLRDQQGSFELGVNPIEQYLQKNNITLETSVQAQLKKLQRVYQITPSDEAMGTLLGRDVDSAYAVMQFGERLFVESFETSLGGQEAARMVYARARQVSNTVLNVYTNLALQRSAPALWATAQLPALRSPEDRAQSGVLAYPTLEELFGEMNYCSCEHCRSWLSPAAYLVDLLQFLEPVRNEENHGWMREVLGRRVRNPLEVLLRRRPDIQHLELTCENTNTALPYIDLVNEVLEHYVVDDSLAAFTGHNTEDGISTEELLANPQFVNDSAYAKLGEQPFPPPMPFNLPLEALRRYFAKFDIPLDEAMQVLRPNDQLMRPDAAEKPEYAWVDILMERLQLSRAEYAILTDSSMPLLQGLYGENPSELNTEQLVEKLSHAKTLARKLDLNYVELVAIIRSHFINPHNRLLPKLEKLGVGFNAIQGFLDGTLGDDEFMTMLSLDELDMAEYSVDVQTSADTDPEFSNAELAQFKPIQNLSDANIYSADIQYSEDAYAAIRKAKQLQLKKWLEGNKSQIMGLIVLSDFGGSDDGCSFDTLELRYALPDSDRNRLFPFEFLKLLRFVRLWRKLGWTVEQTDKALTAFYPEDQIPTAEDAGAIARLKLDAGFQTLIPRLAHLHTVMEQLGQSPRSGLLELLACWSSIDTQGQHSLYRKMFLNPTTMALDTVFEEDGYGRYLQDTDQTIDAHREALRAAFHLIADEFDLIRQELGFDNNATLNLANVSAIFRHAYLARSLRLSVRELLALKSMSGLDFSLPLDQRQAADGLSFGAVRPPAIRFIEMARQIRGSSLQIGQLRHLLEPVDTNDETSSSQQNLLAFARTLRDECAQITRSHTVREDPTGEIARAEMALVYGSETTDVFFELLDNISVFTTEYNHGQTQLQDEITRTTDRIAYDDFKKQLSFQGVMTAAEKAALDGTGGTTDAFRDAVATLFNAGQKYISGFFDRHADLRQLYDSFINNDDSRKDKMSALLAAFMPDLRAKLKDQRICQLISDREGVGLDQVTALLTRPEVLHANGASASLEPAMTDFTILETGGLSGNIFFSSDVTGDADQVNLPAPSIHYGGDGAPLPANPRDKEAPISGVWRGFVEAPASGFYNIYVTSDDGADISLKLDDKKVLLETDQEVSANETSIELEAGRLYKLELTARKVKDVLRLEWQRKGIGRTLIPSAQLYPAQATQRFKESYARLRKVLTIMDVLELSSTEMAYFAADDHYAINDEGWLNALPVFRLPAQPAAQALLQNLLALQQYRQLRDAFPSGGEKLVRLVQAPSAIDDDGTAMVEQVTGWGEDSLSTLLEHFNLTMDDLSRPACLARLRNAFNMAHGLGIEMDTLVANTGNNPNADTVRAIQGALRARYSDSDWLKVIQPISDDLRKLRRNALVRYVLYRLAQNQATSHIDTADKLFEYFLIDVQMDPCMKTSRIKQAISSVQLFTQRCLMNLEKPQVKSSDINGGLWTWMKHYRVWEANRKIFLWPENWLEPELRDNKSPFFKDFESELLQQDITDAAAATALVHYLEKLDEVAKLEICGMYYEENDEIVHAIARTPGARKTYYYRRQNGDKTWTPWEKIDLEIEDNPVLPVVWQGRLFLFWASVRQEPVPPPAETVHGGLEDDQRRNPVYEDETLESQRLSAIDTTLSGISNSLSNMENSSMGEPRVQILLALHWSEHYHGKWQPARSSNVNEPLVFDSDFSANQPKRQFRRGWLSLRSGVADDGELWIRPVYSGYKSKEENKTWVFYNTGSSPRTLVRYIPDNASGLYERSIHTEDNHFTMDGHLAITSHAYFNVVTPMHGITDALGAPIFLGDHRRLMFVTTEKHNKPLRSYLDFGVREALHDSKTPAISAFEPNKDLTAIRNSLADKNILNYTQPVIRDYDLERVDNMRHDVRRIKTISFKGQDIGPIGSIDLKPDS